MQDIRQKLSHTINRLSDLLSYENTHISENDRAMPSLHALNQIVEMTREVLFPGYFGRSVVRRDTLSHRIGVLIDNIFDNLSEQIERGIWFANPRTDNVSHLQTKSRELAAAFIEQLPHIRAVLHTDVQATYLSDPAAISNGEIIYCYPGVRAITNYRIAHCLLKMEIPLIPRIISELAHSETGIDIHPGAEIGEAFSIDHGTGVVIGATCIIGKNVKMYQGVTLGAKSFTLDEQGHPVKGVPRHPIVEDDVVIYSQATVLGRITIGHNSVIGGNVFLTNSVPPYSKIVQSKAKTTTFSDGGGI